MQEIWRHSQVPPMAFLPIKTPRSVQFRQQRPPRFRQKSFYCNQKQVPPGLYCLKTWISSNPNHGRSTHSPKRVISDIDDRIWQSDFRNIRWCASIYCFETTIWPEMKFTQRGNLVKRRQMHDINRNRDCRDRAFCAPAEDFEPTFRAKIYFFEPITIAKASYSSDRIWEGDRSNPKSLTAFDVLKLTTFLERKIDEQRTVTKAAMRNANDRRRNSDALNLNTR
jgi:hypothetical protein